MKRIGILTFHYSENRNFGAALQSYAVVKMLEKMNFEAKLIDYMPYDLTLKGRMLFLLEGSTFRKYFNKFLKSKIKKISKNKLNDLNDKFDIFIVGSDQVWRPKWWPENIKTYFLDFVNKNKTKIAYAASFGVDFWEGNTILTEEIKPLANKFNYVSVREESGIKVCKEIFGINAICVLDPTLMIEKEDYQIILNENNDEKYKNIKYIAHMLLDDDKDFRAESKKISEYLESEINYIKGKDIKILGKTITFYNQVSQWLNYVKNAKLIITDSFHCTVFSIIFNKKFVVVANPNRGTSRLENLLEIIGLKERFFTNIKDVIKSGILDKEINYDEVEKKLNIHREYSMEFLKKALGESNE